MTTKQRTFPVVGFGASAGGLEAMSDFFGSTPTPGGMAFLIVQHLDPAGESHLVDLLSRRTTLTVEPARDGLRIEPDHIYVCVPNRDLVVEDGHLRLLDQEIERSQRRPIDRFFDSMASTYGDRAIAIILSGTAADGSRGISAVKSAGGMVLVQEPETAEFDGMPRSAMDTGLVDLVLPVEKIPEVLRRVASTPRERLLPATQDDATDAALGTLQTILNVLHDRFGYDFADYKRPTLLRRTQRRMSLSNIGSFEAYARRVREDSTEAASLYRDLMINVSRFFRDPEVWAELAQSVVDPLIENRQTGDDIRVWSAGCATGEEAYTIGMILLERIEASGKRLHPQIFATDVSESLDTARAGIYPETISSEVSPERLERFFTERDSMYEVKKHLRDMVVFARHNVINDPPFSRIDIICCRNMLIYIAPETQRRILWLFNFALRDGGALLLGNAEHVDPQAGIFDPISERARIFRSRRVAHAGRFEFPRFSMTNKWHGPMAASADDRSARDEHVSMAHAALLERYAPPSVVIDSAHQVLVYHGDTSRFLAQPGGEPTRDLLTLVASSVRPSLRHAINEVLREKRAAVVATAYTKHEGQRRPVSLTVSPIGPLGNATSMLLVCFEESNAPDAPDADHHLAGVAGESQTVAQLEEELRVARLEVRDVSEQYDRLVEDYSTSNEEMLSVNEELQSANEELETSKEELQSLNEELNTLNNELRSKIEIVEQTNNDLNNLLASTEIATLFLDMNCRIRWSSPAIKQVLQVIPADVGRPIRDLASVVIGSDIEAEACRVIETLSPVETQVEGDDEKYFIRRVMPYRTADNRIDGVVITFVDITEHKRGERQRVRLMNELHHRIKNTLATVQALVFGMERRCNSLPEFIAAFEPRLAALSRAHSILNLPGDEHVAMHEVLSRELAPYLGNSVRRARIEGAMPPLPREMAVALELVFHELATNSAKYGALSNDTGTIDIRWGQVARENGPHARLEWVETGGPRIESVGEAGFGSQMIRSSVQHDLAGTLEMEFKPTGLCCAIEIPITRKGVDDGESPRTTSDGLPA